MTCPACHDNELLKSFCPYCNGAGRIIILRYFELIGLIEINLPQYLPDRQQFALNVIDWLTDPSVDETPPTIEDVVYDPQTPTQDDDVTVTATVSDEGGISVVGVNTVNLLYSNDEGATWNTLSMSLASIDYQSIIPKQSGGTTIQFKIYAEDNAVNSIESDTKSYDIPAPPSAIPGFPLESILLGLILTGFASVLLKKKPSSMI